MFRSLRSATLLAIVGFVCAFPSLLFAQDETAKTITFSRLIVRSTDDWAVAQSDGPARVMILEYLRKKGWNAVGAEDLVFGEDASDRADLILGGTVFDLECSTKWEQLAHCVVGIRWEIRDSATQKTVYRAEVYGQFHDQEVNEEQALRLLLESAIDRLDSKPRVKELLDAPTAAEREPGLPASDKASFKRCGEPPVAIEEDGNWALRSVVLISDDSGVGSGFVISKDPFIITAAHVVDGPRPTLRFKNGYKTSASVLRIDRNADVALLRADDLPEDVTCLAAPESKGFSPGTSVFALGSPGGEELAFSMSRGILSGVRIRNGVAQVQTDASVNPGNSGGPLVDETANALGVVSWKLTGEAVEGLGFAVALQDAYERLAIFPADTSDEGLLTGAAVATAPAEVAVFEEPAETRPALEPRRAARREAVRKQLEKGPFTARHAVRLSPAVGLAQFPNPENPTGSLGATALDLGWEIATTLPVGLFLGFTGHVSATAEC